MEILKKLKEQGWYLTEEGIKKLPDNVDKSDSRKIIQAALDIDFRDIANGALSSEISKKDEHLPGRIVLQVSKVRNISASKANEESKIAPRLLQIDLTDGVNQIQALEMEHISVLSLNTAPGTKLYLKSDKVPLMQGIIMLRPADVQLLGGKVVALFDKWELSRTLLKYARGGRIMSGSSGPPPWTPFGQKIQQNVGNADKNFKSLGSGEKDAKENVEFVAMRNEAIAEAAKGGSKKTFGGGNQPIVDHNVKKILEKGYSEEEAKTALKSTRNNLERALHNLKRREEYKNTRSGDDYRGGSAEKTSSRTVVSTHSATSTSGGRGGGNSRGGGREGFSSRKSGGGGGKEDLTASAKPATNVSLFDFLTDKLPAGASAEPPVTEKAIPQNNNYNTNNSNRYESSNPRHERSNRSNDYSSSSKPYSNNSNNNSNSHHNNHHYSENRNHNTNINHNSGSSNIPNNQSNSRSSNTGVNSTSTAQQSAATKFENNISSSFQAATNRNYPQQDERNNRSGRGGRNNNGNYSYRGSEKHQTDDNSERYSREKDTNRNNNYGGQRNQRGNDRDAGNGGGGRNEKGSSYQGSNSHYQEQQSGGRGNFENPRNSRNDAQGRNGGFESRGSGNQSGRTAQPQSSSSRYPAKENTSNSYQQSATQQHYQQQSNSRSYNNENVRQSSSSSSYHQNQQQPQNQSARAVDSSKITKLVEDTNKLKLESNGGQNQNRHTHATPAVMSQPQQHQQTQPQMVMVSHHQLQQPAQMQQQSQQQQLPLNMQQQQQQHQQHQNAYGQLSNGYTYDPNKIMGFQNKETNDFAMTLLKSQGIQTALGAIASGNGGPGSQMQLGHPQPFTSGPTFMMQPTLPQQSVHPQAAANHQVHQLQQHPQTFGMNPGESWNWKIGDRCLAKYWDDSRYYEAEITGISDKTCVVFYLGYGNHEEVLKCDCLPITDSQNRAINFGSTQSVQPAPIPSGALSRGVPNRYRGERQMYVPPPKREV